MGAGRKTSTYDIDTGAQQLGFVERQRNLGENLGGVIFGEGSLVRAFNAPGLRVLSKGVCKLCACHCRLQS